MSFGCLYCQLSLTITLNFILFQPFGIHFYIEMVPTAKTKRILGCFFFSIEGYLNSEVMDF